MINLQVSLKDLLSDFGVKLSYDLSISGLHDDSRKIKEAFLFVARKGVDADGHDYIKAAIKNGASAVLVNQGFDTSDYDENLKFVAVKDTNEIFPELCQAFYGYPAKDLLSLGVTGTNGKTTTSFIVEYLLKSLGYESLVFGTVDYRFCDYSRPALTTSPSALDLAEMMYLAKNKGLKYSIMEASSHALDQGRMSSIQFAAGAFTNLSQDHLDYHDSFESYFSAKMKLFDQSDAKVVNLSDEYGKRIKEKYFNAFTYSVDNYTADLFAANINYGIDGTFFDLIEGSVKHRLKIPFVGRHNVENVLCALGILMKAGFDLKDLIKSVSSLPVVPGRLEAVNNDNGLKAFVDYAHTPDAVESILSSVRKSLSDEYKILTLVGCGGNRDKAKRPLMALAALAGSDYCIFTSDNPRYEDPLAILNDMVKDLDSDRKDFEIESDREKAISIAVSKLVSCDEKWVLMLLGKGHEDYQEIEGERFPMDDRKLIQKAISMISGELPS